MQQAVPDVRMRTATQHWRSDWQAASMLQQGYPLTLQPRLNLTP